MGIHTKQLTRMGYHDHVARSLAVTLVAKYGKHRSDEEIERLLQDLRACPEQFANDPAWGKLAQHFLPSVAEPVGSPHALNSEPLPYRVYGCEQIEQEALRQMEMAMRLPVAVAGALMADGHAGYGLPIGGVLATKGAIIPYAVGVDIGCGMRLSIFDADERFLKRYRGAVEKALMQHTHFGMDGGLDLAQDHEVLTHPDFGSTDLLRRLHGKAVRQLGTSGGGNHFVDFGLITLEARGSHGLTPGTYVALLSHSGSRGLGAEVANHYSRLAADRCSLPKQVQHLAWLDLHSEIGQEYLLSMNLAAAYASACHDRIHFNLGRALGLHPLMSVGGHHNLAWEEEHPAVGQVMVHRKGATPAHRGQWGVIPGSMGTKGYLVSGLGNPDSLCSASHGAGRRLSRREAHHSISRYALRQTLKEAGVTLLGGGVDEAPEAYKNIDEVMAHQQTLVRVEGTFVPHLVRMADAEDEMSVKRKDRKR